ncbi:tetratricopeptide repeat protein [Paractinoplanes lichenicola]|uniref:CHAT domain-containing protein n=1 Tax=Paractinoplanes lichenicola TaxID=2802976 RepID=A0ABS1W3C8_9ACTN|nr:tetratricopeptide repeat protein [Actinoplanes lichenicola]MBL7261244.1 CHAT domain-containing protein [Actinoplanes lichenicola]
MTVIAVRERSAGADGSFSVDVRVGDAEHTAVVAGPFDAAQEQELVWYFEEHLRYPFLDWDRRDAAALAVADYGRALFGQLFADEEARHSYRKLRESGFDGCRIEVVGSAGLHRLHWETLRDPEYATPLAVRLPLTRRVTGQGTRFDLPADRAAVNILVVTARPDGPKDVGYRTVSRPLLEALRQADVPVTVEFVRPGTWAALRDALQAKSETVGTGWFQVVHFDVHGLFGAHKTLEEGRRGGRLTFDPAEVPAFEGQQGVLFFETATDGVAQPVPAKQVAELLAEHRVPVAVLNACQSATQSATEAGLAQQLAQAGVPLAVGMAYSVTVSAAAAAMPVLYGKFAAGSRPIEAAHAARRALFEKRGRRGYFDQVIDLEDWVLPVVFSQRPFDLRLRARTPAEEAEFYEREAEVGPEPSPRYGFVGRDLDVQAIERRLLMAGNELLVRGMAGAGKSTLLAHLGWWWHRTGLVERVFAFSYEDRAWTADQIVREIAKKLLTAVEQTVLDSFSESARLERIAGLLRARRFLLVLDNAESITASPAAIPHALDSPQRDRLVELLRRLRGGRSLVLIGSRQDEGWLVAGNSYDLPGLDPQAASQLVERILHEHGGSHYRSDPGHRDALRELVKLLGGYPLPMTVVLPALGTTTPAEILAQLQQGDVAADPVGIIRRAIEYSHGNLDPTVQQSMLLLAPFTATIPTGPVLSAYQEELEAIDSVRALGTIDLAAAINETARVGLATPHQFLPLAEVVPILPYFLRTRLNNQPDLTAAARHAHYRLHLGLAKAIHDLLTGLDPRSRAVGQALAQAMYANLITAIEHGTDTGQYIEVLVAAIAVYLRRRNQLAAFAQLLADVLNRHRADGGGHSQLESAFLNGFAGRTALDQHRLDDAEHYYRVELTIRENTDDRKGQATAHHQLGVVTRTRRRFGEAERHYRQALDIYLDLEDRHSAAITYYQLGSTAQERQRVNEAERHYRQALDIFLSFNDRSNIATVYHQLGVLCHVQDRHEEALTAMLSSAIYWHEDTGLWPGNALVGIVKVREHIADEAFIAAVRSIVPASMVDDFLEALRGTSDGE